MRAGETVVRSIGTRRGLFSAAGMGADWEVKNGSEIGWNFQRWAEQESESVFMTVFSVGILGAEHPPNNRFSS